MLSTELIYPLEFAKFLFFVSYIAATVGVIIGVYWEGEQFDKETQRRGWALLVRSLALDTLFTILIFGTDGWIGTIQRSEITTLETRLAARTLSDGQLSDIVGRLKQFAGQEFDIVTYWKNPESLAITNRIYAALLTAQWKYDKPKSGEFILGVQTGVSVWHDDRAQVEAVIAANELVAALNANGITASADDTPQAHGQNEPIINKLVINVGIKP